MAVANLLDSDGGIGRSTAAADGAARLRAVLFDVDGTLLDTNYLHAVAWLRAFDLAGFTVPAFEIHRRIGMSGERLMAELIGEPRDDVKDEWRRQYDAMKGDVRPLPGARDLLFELAGRGLTVGLATSSPPTGADSRAWAC